jgi:hypothetical protein
MKDRPTGGRTARISRDRRALDAANPDRARLPAVRRSAARAPARDADEALVAGGERSFDLVALDEALERLAAPIPSRGGSWSCGSSAG